MFGTFLLWNGCSPVQKNKTVNYNNTINEIWIKIVDLTWIYAPIFKKQ